jgi:glycosyltransferase involved in cell wall biosynthesis
MKIGYLHIGPPEHGVCRYGRLLAAEARRRPNLTVIEADVILTEDRKHNREMLVKAAQRLSEAEVIHFQSSSFNTLLWGGGWPQLYYLQVFMRHCSCPLVVTLHDVFYPPYGLVNILRYAYSKLQPTASSPNKETITTLPDKLSGSKPSILTRGVKFVQRIFQGSFSPEALALRKIATRAHLIFVHSEEEKQRLHGRIDKCKVRAVPHFVEARSVSISPAEARATLGLDGVKTVTLLGFIYFLKGHQLMVEAMSELPQDVKVIFAGGPCIGEDEQFVQELSALAKARGVDDRLQVTGYLSEEELERYLSATDLAVCPFVTTSASGSLSTWISVARPILASDLPQVADYNKFEPDAIKTFKPYTPTALAQAIQKLLPTCRESNESAVVRLRQKLSISVIFDEHLTHYRLLLQHNTMYPRAI